MLVDSHAHLDSERYDADREAMLQRARGEGVSTILSIGIGDGPDTMHRAAEISAEYAGRTDVPTIYASAGIHPHEASLATDAAYDRLCKMAAQDNVIAIGEIGLDFFYDNSPREVQREVFIRQMGIAARHRLPIIIHCRPSENSFNAWDETLAMLKTHWYPTGLPGILHCFTGTAEHANAALAIGFCLSFAGNVTFPKAEALRRVAADVPEDRLLIETDAPFLAPVPKRGQRNEPAWVRSVAAQLAEIRQSTLEHVAWTTAENFRRLFDLV